MICWYFSLMAKFNANIFPFITFDGVIIVCLNAKSINVYFYFILFWGFF